ncbi:indolepyruvate ferredoxin oxidoreductase [Boseongicola aestuarii]|uniref:Indolepyruvate ferredoxin oxidoreductase n=2 Tax=Boseongicola aestuarii TaxID=1470561 RepID=A0A238IUN3_9RHOB|nr:indolepyruvate ferredoxin oxidoreductase [Boseongicola aestuarii]
MSRHTVSLHDKYDLSKDTVLLNGSQALVRLMLMQKARDAAAGLDTAGYVSGYRGSPLGAVDTQMKRAKADLEAANVLFHAGLNEDLAATAVWGTQTAEIRGEGKHDGVFALWYGKGPGVDRSGDAIRHGNLAGSSRHGGVVLALGDDHVGESSTTCHQSEFAMVDAQVPILSPAGVQEILDFGLYGYALSRFSGLWTSLKLMKDTVEVTSVVDARIDRKSFVIPDFDMPEGGLNIRLGDHWVPQESRLVDHKRFAAEAFARANRPDARMHGQAGAKIGFVAAGKNWLDLIHALSLLALDEAAIDRLGITTYKLGQVYPIDSVSFREWADGLDLIVVVEEKRKLIEGQIKEALFDTAGGRRVYGWFKPKADGSGREELFQSHYSLDPVAIAEKIGKILIEEGRENDALKSAMTRISQALAANNATEIAARLPYYCSGCPHNTSTKVPAGSRAYAGIGCHTMVLWMDRETTGYTHMGAEGMNWVGEAPFSTTGHVFQNMGDGTYNHSGLLAIRGALDSEANITFKILYNGAVALTGGQDVEGGLTAHRVAHELVAMGVENVAVVFDEKEEPRRKDFPASVEWFARAELPHVQEKYRNISGVSVILYVQTCAAEKRRKRKRGAWPDPDKRVFIDPDVCEGCGDCGVQSNCVSIVPFETELGRKRAIDQSSCNKDYSCLKGFCPSFVTVEGAKLRKNASVSLDIGELGEPVVPDIEGPTHNVVIAGVGGAGVITIGAVLAMAAHLEGKGASMMEMAGLAQKGGAVHVHCRLAKSPGDISAIRVAVGECDTLIGGDLVVSAGAKTIGLMTTGRTKAFVNAHEIVTGEFTRNTEFRIPSEDLAISLRARVQDDLTLFDVTKLAQDVIGDAIYANMILLGASWQKGHLPLGRAAIEEAIALNGTSVEDNLRAFQVGRWLAGNIEVAERLIASDMVAKPKTLQEKIDFRAAHLTEYQSARLAGKYRKMLDRIKDDDLKEAVAKGYHKLLSYKDEYEVARLLSTTRAKAEAVFEGDLKLTYNLAPPLLSRNGPDGRPLKRAFGTWIERLWPHLARLKRLRGSPFDPFGYTAERRMERRLIKEYEHDIRELIKSPPLNRDAALALAELPMKIKGFGPVKQKNALAAAETREALKAALNVAPDTRSAA